VSYDEIVEITNNLAVLNSEIRERTQCSSKGP
jgi:hypothetical protein